MDSSEIATLKASAFALSKILKGRQIKLSSQQCLDALSRLVANAPFEALLATKESPRPVVEGEQPMTDIPTLKGKASVLRRILKEHHLKESSQFCLDTLARLVVDARFDALLAKHAVQAPQVLQATKARNDEAGDDARKTPADPLQLMMPVSRPASPWKKGSSLVRGDDGMLSDAPTLDPRAQTVWVNLPPDVVDQSVTSPDLGRGLEKVPTDLPIPQEGQPDTAGWTLHPSSSGSGWVVTRGYSTSTHGGFVYNRGMDENKLDLVRSGWKQPPMALYSTKALAVQQREHLESREAKGIWHPQTTLLAQEKTMFLAKMGRLDLMHDGVADAEAAKKKARRRGP